jgi:hypothetical protein
MKRMQRNAKAESAAPWNHDNTKAKSMKFPPRTMPEEIRRKGSWAARFYGR